jgi:hypothetical protein
MIFVSRLDYDFRCQAVSQVLRTGILLIALTGWGNRAISCAWAARFSPALH